MSEKHFENKECKYYPCHNLKYMNCLFCFCPLYNYENCGGIYAFKEDGLKDCSKCLLLHNKDSYDYITKQLAKEMNAKIIRQGI
jgi:Zn-finger protein